MQPRQFVIKKIKQKREKNKLWNFYMYLLVAYVFKPYWMSHTKKGGGHISVYNANIPYKSKKKLIQVDVTEEIINR